MFCKCFTIIVDIAVNITKMSELDDKKETNDKEYDHKCDKINREWDGLREKIRIDADYVYSKRRYKKKKKRLYLCVIS